MRVKRLNAVEALQEYFGGVYAKQTWKLMHRDLAVFLLSNQYPLHLIYRHLIVPPIIQRRGPRRFMCRHLPREFLAAPIAQIFG